MKTPQPKYKEGERLIYNTQKGDRFNERVEVVIIRATCFDDYFKTWYYKAISNESNQFVYVEEINLENQTK